MVAQSLHGRSYWQWEVHYEALGASSPEASAAASGFALVALWPSAFPLEDGSPRLLFLSLRIGAKSLAVMFWWTLPTSAFLSRSLTSKLGSSLCYPRGKRSVQFSPWHTGSLACLYRGSPGFSCYHDYAFLLALCTFDYTDWNDGKPTLSHHFTKAQLLFLFFPNGIFLLKIKLETKPRTWSRPFLY